MCAVDDRLCRNVQGLVRRVQSSRPRHSSKVHERSASAESRVQQQSLDIRQQSPASDRRCQSPHTFGDLIC